MSARGYTVAAGVVVLGLVATGGVIATQHTQAAATTTSAPTATGTAKVTRTTLRTTRQLFGNLGFAGRVDVFGVTGGTAYTWLPAPGTVINQGDAVSEVDGHAVPLLLGSRPVWRAMAVGMTPGPDVVQLNAALAALGYATDATEDHFTWVTTAAVRRWQQDRGVLVTGRLDLGQVVFAPGPLRVQTVPAHLGAQPRPGEPLLSATSTTRVVDLPVPIDQVHLLHPHDPVAVTLPDAHSQTTGSVSVISPVVTQPQPSDSPGGRPPTPHVQVTIALDDPATVAAYTSAPVSVAVTTASANGVLAVPVTALLAQPGGAFAVTVVDDSGHRQVPVTPGIFADTLVQVSGPGITEGANVEVPAP